MYNFPNDLSAIGLFRIEVDTGSRIIGCMNTVDLLASRTDVDGSAETLSKLMPQTTIRVFYKDHVRAIYKAGSRSVVTDMKSFYEGMSQQEYEASQFKCSRTQEMV